MAQQWHPLRPIGYRRDGRPIYPILGGSEPPAQPASDPTPAAPAAPDKGFPENTPLVEMTIEQREAYWKHQARRHETRAKAFDGLTPEHLAELREKAKKQEATEYELSSATEKAVADATTAARAEIETLYQPQLVRAEFRAELKGRVPDDQLPERLATITEPLDLAKFLTSSGEVDTDKVAAFVNGIAPATGTPAPPPPPKQHGPSPSGQGQRPGSSASPSVASGRELYAQRHRKSA